MKKIKLILPVFALLFIVAVPVYAKDETVDIDTVKGYASSVSVSGTTDAVAVAIQVRNGDTIVSMDTVGTKDGKFQASVAGQYAVGTTYTVYVADYEGGTWETESTTAIADPVPPTPPAPSGSDNNSSVAAASPDSNSKSKEASVDKKAAKTTKKQDQGQEKETESKVQDEGDPQIVENTSASGEELKDETSIETEVTTENQVDSMPVQEETKTTRNVVIAIVIILLLILAAILGYIYWDKSKKSK